MAEYQQSFAAPRAGRPALGLRPRAAARSPWSLRVVLTLASVILCFAISGPTLSYLGVEYVIPGGNPVEKIHPATFVATLSILFLCFTGELPGYIDIMFRRHVGIAVFLGLWLLLMIYIAKFVDSPITTTIDTFYYTIAITVLMLRLQPEELGIIRWFLHGFMVVNSLLAAFELVSGHRLVPMSIGSADLGVIAMPYEWRPSAFLGHPLAGGSVTGTYVLVLMFARQNMNMMLRLCLLGINTLGLVAYSSRSALALVALCAAAYYFMQFCRVLAGKTLRRDTSIIFFISVPAGIVGGSVLLVSGFLDKFMDKLSFDKGSAETRSMMFDVFGSVRFHDLMFGPPSVWLADTLMRYNVYAVESFELGFLLFYGIIGCLIFFPGLIAYLVSILRCTQREAILPILFFFVNASVSVSISSKSMALAQSIILILASMRVFPPRDPPRQRPRPALASRHVSLRPSLPPVN